VAFTEAAACARRALELDARIADAHLGLGHYALFLERDWDSAYAHYARAIELAPLEEWPAYGMMQWLSSVGRFDEAVDLARRAGRADPVNPAAVTMLALACYLAHRFPEGVAAADAAIAFAPTFSEAHRWRALCLFCAGRHSEALVSIDEAYRLSDGHAWAAVNKVSILHQLGRGHEAEALFSDLVRRAETEPIPPYALVVGALHSVPPDIEGAVRWLERSLDAGDFWLVMSRIEPGFDPSRADPRIAAMVERIGIPPVGYVAGAS
jgi:tetratricopeptide (TPR) repeat protein